MESYYFFAVCEEYFLVCGMLLRNFPIVRGFEFKKKDGAQCRGGYWFPNFGNLSITDTLPLGGECDIGDTQHHKDGAHKVT